MQYAILSDIHANYSALQAVEDDIIRLQKDRQIDIQIWFLGDLVGYGPTQDAISCVRWLRDKKIENRWVAGNHDEWLVNPQGQLSPEATVSLNAQRATLMARPVFWEWFCNEVNTSLETIITINSDGTQKQDEARSLGIEQYPKLQLLFAHASFRQRQRRISYLRPWIPGLLAADLADIHQQHPHLRSCFFHGHTHFPVLASLLPHEHRVKYLPIKYFQPILLPEGVFGINPGSVGQPRDGDPRAAYVIVDTDNATIEFRRVDYNTRRVSDLLKADAERAENEADQQAFQSLADRVLTANGRAEMQFYRSIYRSPLYDLEAVAIGHL